MTDQRSIKIKELEAEIERFKAADRADIAKTQKVLGEAKVSQAGRKEPVYSNFRVSWKKDGKIEKLQQTGDLSYEQLCQMLQGVERACMEKLKGDREGQGQKVSPQLLKAAYRRRAEDRQLRVRLLEERIHKLRKGTVDPVGDTQADMVPF